MPETHENGKAFPWSEWECCKCVQKVPKPSFLIWGVFLGLLSSGDRLPRPGKLLLTADSPPFLVVAAVDTLHLSKPSLPSSGFSAYAPLFCPFFIPSLPQTAFTNEDRNAFFFPWPVCCSLSAAELHPVKGSRLPEVNGTGERIPVVSCSGTGR